MYGLLHFLVRWPTTPNTHLQHATNSLPPNGSSPNIHTLCQVRVKNGLCVSPRLLNLKVWRLKPWHTELLHTTAGPGSFRSAVHFSPHFLYIIHAIKHIKFSIRYCLSGALNDKAICVWHAGVSRKVRKTVSSNDKNVRRCKRFILIQ